MEELELKIEHVSVSIHKTEILKNISLIAQSSKMTVILGVNGEGKTTLFRSIAGILPVTEGKISFMNTDVTALKPKERAQLIAYSIQNTGGEIDTSVIEFILAGVTPYLKMFEYGNQEHYKQARAVLEQFKLLPLEHRSLMSLSGGERQKVYLARNFMQNATVLLMDEPTTYLDYKAQNQFFKFFVSFIKEHKKIALVTMQDPNLALKYADVIICLHQGAVLDILTPKAIGFRERALMCFRKMYGEEVLLHYDGDYYIRM